MDGFELRESPVSDEQGLRLGRVVSVSGSQVVILLENHDNGKAAEEASALQMGALVKMRTPGSTVFGLVSGLSIPIPGQDAQDNEMKIVELELLGEAANDANGGQGSFQRGVAVFPALGDIVYASTQDDLAQVYARPAVSNVRVGTIHQDPSVPAFLVTDDLLGKHFAVLGTTGSGKSCAVALILRAILSRHSNGHILLLDPHNEYSRAFGDAAEVLDTASLQLPYWLLTFDEIVEIMFGTKTKERAAEVTILNELILAAKRTFLGSATGGEVISVDTPIPYRLGELVRIIDEAMGKLDRPENSAPYMRIKSLLSTLQTDQRYAFMFPGLAVRDNLASILSTLFRLPVDGKPVTIVDLSGVPSEILNVVVSVLARMTFDFALWSDRETPILLVCEEAHRYVPNDKTAGFGPTRRSISRIAREGRKYGVSLCLVSQRPSELDPAILSQCNTLIALRMSNERDHEFVRHALPESAHGLLGALPSLKVQEAIVVGEGVTIPLRVTLDDLDEARRPRGSSASFSQAWQSDIEDDGIVKQTMERWRHQDL